MMFKPVILWLGTSAVVLAVVAGCSHDHDGNHNHDQGTSTHQHDVKAPGNAKSSQHKSID